MPIFLGLGIVLSFASFSQLDSLGKSGKKPRLSLKKPNRTQGKSPFSIYSSKSKLNYSFENDILTKAVELKTLVAYKTDQQYFSITNLKMLKKFEITSKKLNLNYIKWCKIFIKAYVMKKMIC